MPAAPGLDPAVGRKLTRFRRRRTRLLLARGLAVGVAAVVVALLPVALADWYWPLSDDVRWLLSGSAYGFAALAGLAACAGRLRLPGGAGELADRIETAEPAVRDRLRGAVDLAADDPATVADSPAFRARVQADAADRMGAVRVRKLLPASLIGRWLAAAALVVALAAGALWLGGERVRLLAARAALPGANLARVSRVTVEVLEPSPPSRTLPAGETVAVVVRTSGDAVESAVLEVTPLDPAAGNPEELTMRPRVAGPDGAGSDDTFAVNLTLPPGGVSYRVRAGDGLTRRHRLDARPRPAVTAFAKRFVFPPYAGLPDDTVTEPTGDLAAVTGTVVTLTLAVNQPVRSAELFVEPAGGESRTVPLEPTGDRWTASLTLNEPGTYRVRLVAADTGFDDPFAPRHELRPLTDAPPRAAWVDPPAGPGDAPPLVAPDAALPLAAAASDDLPLDALEQAVSVNGREVARLPLVFEPAGDGGRAISAAWDWDLLPLDLKTGDEVTARVVVTDRKGQSGQSPPLRFIVAGRDFDPDRHAAAEARLALVGDLAAYSERLTALREEAKAALDAGEIDALRESVTALREAAGTAFGAVTAVLPSQPAGADAADLDAVGRLIAVTLRDRPAPAAARLAEFADGPLSGDAGNDVRAAFEKAAEDAVQAERAYRRLTMHPFLAALAADLGAIREHQSAVVDGPPQTPDSLARQETVIAGRLEDVEAFVAAHRDRLTDEARREADDIAKWSAERRAELAGAADDPDGLLRAARKVRDELEWRGRPNALHGSVAGSLTNARRDLENRTGELHDRAREAADAVAREAQARAALNDAGDSADAERLRATLDTAALQVDLRHRGTLDRLRELRTLTRARPDGDAAFAADAALARRAVSAVLDARAEPGALPENVAAADALKEIGPAFRLLEAAHELAAAETATAALLERERWESQTPAARLDHPRQWDLIDKTFARAADLLKRAGSGPEIERAIGAFRWSPATQAAGRTITERRWKNEGAVSADADLRTFLSNLGGVRKTLAPQLAEARATLAKYAPTLPEMARDAAAAVREREAAARAAASENGGADPAELVREQAEVNAEIADLLEALADDADARDLSDADERAAARDADAAVEAVRDPAERADRALRTAAASPDRAAEELAAAADRQAETAAALDLVAEHFERLNAGEEVTATREALRAAERAAGVSGEHDDRFAPAERAAAAAEGDPAELMAELEAELAENAAMREALSEIAADAAADAANALTAAAAEERSVRSDLERSDAAFRQKKEALAEGLRDLSADARRLSDRLVEEARKAAERGDAKAARQTLADARDTLKAAAQAAANADPNAPLEELAAAAEDAREPFAAVAEAIERAAKDAETRAGEATTDDAKAREKQRRDAERDRDQFRQRQRREAQSRVRQADDARRRVEQQKQKAEREARDAQNRLDRAEQEAKKDPDDRGRADKVEQEAKRQAQKAAALSGAAEEFARADARRDRVKAEADAENRRPNPPLDAANPAAQLAAGLAKEAAADAAALAERGAELAAAAGFGSELSPEANELARGADRQEAVTGTTEAAAAEVARAARHEARLDRPAAAEVLAGQSEAIAAVAAGESSAAETALSAAAPPGDGGETSDGEPNAAAVAAGESVAAAQSALAERAAALSEAAAGEPGDSGATGRSPRENAAGVALARQLDELDRLAAAAEAGGKSGGEPNPAGPPSAFAAAARAAAAAASADRAAALDRATAALAPPSQSSSPPSGSPADGAGPGGGPDPAFVLGRADRSAGGEWGALRKRAAEEVAAGRADAVAEEDRAAVAAYFKALAERARESE